MWHVLYLSCCPGQGEAVLTTGSHPGPDAAFHFAAVDIENMATCGPPPSPGCVTATWGSTASRGTFGVTWPWRDARQPSVGRDRRQKYTSLRFAYRGLCGQEQTVPGAPQSPGQPCRRTCSFLSWLGRAIWKVVSRGYLHKAASALALPWSALSNHRQTKLTRNKHYENTPPRYDYLLNHDCSGS
jgi:hypothetical protein